MGWFTDIAIAATITVLAVGGVLWLPGRLLIEEFTRPGVTVEQGTPQWGGWAFPEAIEEPLKDLRRTVTFQAADGVLLHGEFWAQKCGAPTIIVSHGFHLPSRYFHSVAALEETMVPFQPREDRPVYCSDCYQPRQSQRANSRSRW